MRSWTEYRHVLFLPLLLHCFANVSARIWLFWLFSIGAAVDEMKIEEGSKWEKWDPVWLGLTITSPKSETKTKDWNHSKSIWFSVSVLGIGLGQNDENAFWTEEQVSKFPEITKHFSFCQVSIQTTSCWKLSVLSEKNLIDDSASQELIKQNCW